MKCKYDGGWMRNRRSLSRRLLAASCALSLAAMQPATGQIQVTGDVTPTYTGEDPWDAGLPL
jgi:hypothetical protein